MIRGCGTASGGVTPETPADEISGRGEICACIFGENRVYYSGTCRCVGIGRRSGLKIHRWQHRAGSSPATGTRTPQKGSALLGSSLLQAGGLEPIAVEPASGRFRPPVRTLGQPLFLPKAKMHIEPGHRHQKSRMRMRSGFLPIHSSLFTFH